MFLLWTLDVKIVTQNPRFAAQKKEILDQNENKRRYSRHKVNEFIKLILILTFLENLSVDKVL